MVIQLLPSENQTHLTEVFDRGLDFQHFCVLVWSMNAVLNEISLISLLLFCVLYHGAHL